MNYRKTLIALTIYSLSASIALLGSQAQRSLNLVLLIDTKDDQLDGPLTYNLALAIKQKAAPIIVSENVLYNFFALRASLTPQEVKELKDITHTNEQRLKETTQEIEKLRLTTKAGDDAEKKFKHISEILKEHSEKFNSLKLYTAEPISSVTLDALAGMINDYQKTLQALHNDFSPHSHGASILGAQDATMNDMLSAIKKMAAHSASHDIDDQKLTLSLGIIKLSGHTMELQTAAFNDYMNTMELQRLTIEVETLKTTLEVREKESVLFYHDVSFNMTEWHVYKHAQASVYILIPKTYVTLVEKEWGQYHTSTPEQESKEYTPHERALGLMVDHPAIMQPLPATLTHEQFHDFIFDRLTAKVGIAALFLDESIVFPLSAFQQCLVPLKQPDSGAWNIFLNGHGLYQEIVSPAQEKEFIEKDKEIVLEMNTIVQDALSSLPAPKKTITPKEIATFSSEINRLFIAYVQLHNENIFDSQKELFLNFLEDILSESKTIEELMDKHSIAAIIKDQMSLHHYLSIFQKKIEQELAQLTKKIHQLSEAKSEVAHDSNSSIFIAGLSLEQFKDFLKFLNSKVKTSFLYYMTCFGGGFNAEQVRLYMQKLETTEKQTLNNMPSGFIVAAGSVTDESIIGFTLSGEPIPLNFIGFFNSLKQFFSRDATFKQDPITTILSNVTIRSRTKEHGEFLHGISDIPLVYIPGAGIMRAQEIDKEIMVLTHAKLKALELVIPKKKTTIEPIKTAGKSGLLFYPTIINVPVILGVDSKGHPTALVPMTVDPAIYEFRSIDASTIPLNTFLRESIMDVRSVMTRIFKIQELRCKNYKNSGLPGGQDTILTFNDVTIQSTILPVYKGENIQWDTTFTSKEGITFSSIMLDSYEDPKNSYGRSISAPVWKKIGVEKEQKKEKEHKEAGKE